MALSRRQFLKGALIGGAGLALPTLPLKMMRRAYAFSQSPAIPKFKFGLPGLTPAGANQLGQYIPLATKHTIPFAGRQTDLYDVLVTKFDEQVLPHNVAGKTTFFGYSDFFTLDRKYLGGVIVVKRGTPVLLSVTNLLANKHILPVDPTIMAGPPDQLHPMGLTVGDLPLNRIATHLHGGLTPWFSDGTPFQWFTPLGQHGPSFMNVPGTIQIPGTGTYYYPNDQSARLVWYHDHAIGLTRLNAYAGIASAYIITDDFEAKLINTGLLPNIGGAYTLGVPLILQDKTFFDPRKDPKYPVTGATKGDLWYPWEYEPTYTAAGFNPKGRWDQGPFPPPTVPPTPPTVGTMPLPPISAIPEFFADTAMVNGAPYPVVKVKANNGLGNTFRFRILNGSQARFYHLNLYLENPAGSGEVTSTLTSYGKPDLSAAIAGPPLYQIGTEGGFLPAVALHPNGISCPLDLVGDPNGDTAIPDGPFNLLLAPAERADLLVDLPVLPNGTAAILYNDAPGPFPGGDARNDYFTGDPDFTDPTKNVYGVSGGAAPTVQNFGPNTRTIMKIVVDNKAGLAGAPIHVANILGALNSALAANFTPAGYMGVPGQQPPLLAQFVGGQYVIPAGTPIFNKTLNEDFDDFGRLLQRGGTDAQNGNNNQGLPTFGRGYLEAATEVVNAGSIQAWDFYNTTMDTHPWHFHLVNVQVVGRGVYALKADGTPDFGNFTDLNNVAGQLTPPDLNELGWKETVRMNPGEVTRVIMKFDLPKLPKAMGDPKSPRTGDHEYVHHCHILEHEEHDMMRPLIVK